MSGNGDVLSGTLYLGIGKGEAHSSKENNTKSENDWSTRFISP